MKATLTDRAVKSRRLIGPSLAWLLLCHISSHVSAQIIVRPPADVPQSLTGVPHIHDGDTVEIRGVKVRITGIDAPEMDQRCLDAKGKLSECGIEVRNQLTKKAAGRQWTCRVSGKDRYGRSLASCHVDGEDIARWMVRSGLALSFKRYSHEYDAEETTAIEARAGLWSGAFIAPWDWRSRNTSTEILGAVSVPIDAQKDLLRRSPVGRFRPKFRHRHLRKHPRRHRQQRYQQRPAEQPSTSEATPARTEPPSLLTTGVRRHHTNVKQERRPRRPQPAPGCPGRGLSWLPSASAGGPPLSSLSFDTQD